MNIHPLIYRKLTWTEQLRMTNAKKTAAWVGILLGLLLLSAGCVTHPGWAVVNNTGYSVVVTQDGQIAAQLKPGQSVELLSKTLREPSLVSVVAYEGDVYIGVNTYTFSVYAPYNWQVDSVYAPKGVSR